MKSKTILGGLILGILLIAVFYGGGLLAIVGSRQVPGEVHIGDTLRHKFALFCDDQQGCFGVRATTSLVKPSGGSVSTVGLNKDSIYSSDGIGFSGTSDSFETMLPYTHIVTLYAKDFTLFDTYPTGEYTLDTTVEYKTASNTWKQAFTLAESVNVLAKPVVTAPVVSPPPAGASNSVCVGGVCNNGAVGPCQVDSQCTTFPAQTQPATVVVQPTQPAPITAPTPGCAVVTSSASAWSSCAGGLQARVVSDNCGGKVQESQECFSFPAFRWDYAIIVGAAGLLLVVFAVSGKKKRRR